uniref:Uncharacterized protein n=1 Tax=Panagrolaimus sp. PS1159 TaxID=55785 RepID=A0AC35GGU5_9BILA
MWTPYYLSSTTSFDFNRNEKENVQQIRDSLKNPYDWQGNKNEYYTPREQPHYKWPSEYFASQEAAAAANRQNQRFNQNREQQSPYAPPANYNQQNPNYRFEQWPQLQNRRINIIEQNNHFQPPQPYSDRRQQQYNNNQQAQHSRQFFEKPPAGGSFSPYSNEG